MKSLGIPGANFRNRLGEEVDGDAFVARAWPAGPRVARVEGRWRYAGDDQTEQQSREYVRDIQLAGVDAVGEDHAWPEYGDGEVAQIVGFSQEDFAGPFADAVAVGIPLVDLTDRDRAADIAVFVNQMPGD